MYQGIKTADSGFIWFHRLLDSIMPICSLFIFLVAYSVPLHERYLTMGILGGFVFVLSSQATGSYANWGGRPYYSSMKSVLNSWVQ